MSGSGPADVLLDEQILIFWMQAAEQKKLTDARSGNGQREPMKRKIAFVVQRYGPEVNGGAELLCRQLAERMAAFYEVEVLTTKAIDYITWKNEYPNAQDEVNGIVVRRFPVEKERNIRSFNQLSQKVIGVPHSAQLEERWFDEQGPYCPALIDYIGNHADDYDAFLFFTYLYYTTVRGLPKVPQKAILIPTAHDEPPIYLDYFNRLFSMPKAIFYNTVEEKNFTEKKFRNGTILNNGGRGGAGVDVPEHVDPGYVRENYDVSDYMVYVGRIEEAKGCKELFDYFMQYKKTSGFEDLKLLLLGKAVMPVPKHRDIISLGFVPDEVKFNVIAGARFLVLPSRGESLSIVVLEAMRLSVPVLVSGYCDVLKGHCVRSNAGLYYRTFREFEGCVNYLLTHEEQCLAMGRNGVNYVEENYQWDVIIGHLCEMVEAVV